jgi:hypothetical protein
MTSTKMVAHESTWVNVIWLVLGPFSIYIGVRKEPICYRNVRVPLPNQKLARSCFIVLGLVFILGAIWNLWGGTWGI